jgi:hypothetical protein
MDMLARLDDDDPARAWFDLWRCALTTAVAPEPGLAEIEAALPPVLARARPPTDWVASQLLSCKAAGLAMVRRLDEAGVAAEEALGLAPVGRESRDQALAMIAWLLYLRGRHADRDLLADISAQNQELGLAELCGAPGVMCAAQPLGERAARLVAASHRKPPTDVPTPYLLAFAWLAVEGGDCERAARLAAVAELYDSSTQVSLLHLLARIEHWTGESWARERDAAIGRYLSRGHERAAGQGAAVLGDEVGDWERRLREGPSVTPV